MVEKRMLVIVPPGARIQNLNILVAKVQIQNTKYACNTGTWRLQVSALRERFPRQGSDARDAASCALACVTGIFGILYLRKLVHGSSATLELCATCTRRQRDTLVLHACIPISLVVHACIPISISTSETPARRRARSAARVHLNQRLGSPWRAASRAAACLRRLGRNAQARCNRSAHHICPPPPPPPPRSAPASSPGGRAPPRRAPPRPPAAWSHAARGTHPRPLPPPPPRSTPQARSAPRTYAKIPNRLVTQVKPAAKNC